MTQNKLASYLGYTKQGVSVMKKRTRFFQLIWAGWWLKNNKPEMFAEAIETIKDKK